MAQRKGQGSEPLLVAEAGEAYHAVPEGDPIVAWLDLIEVVEALVPEPATAPKPLVLRDFRL